MKSDLDRLMREREFDAILVSGPSNNNPVMYYMVNGATVGEDSLLVKKRGEPPVLLVNAMERDEAAKSGLSVVIPEKHAYAQMLSDEGGDRLRASIRFREKLLNELGVRGQVAIYGQQEIGPAVTLTNAFNARHNGIHLVGEYADNVFETAWLTKDADEIECIRQVGLKTMNVVGSIAEFLTSHGVVDATLVKSDGSALTVGDVKAQIRTYVNAEGIEDPDGVIFSIGRDAAVGHSSGTAADRIELGKTIVFDIFPREPGGGYYFDFTRTWCLGFAPPEVERAHRDVMDALSTVVPSIRAGDAAREHEARICDIFEAGGHPTHRSAPGSQSGYYHTLGHGIGLNVHEPPYFRLHENYTLPPGCVVTIEPGLYYPEEGYGVRIEDCCWMNPATGRFEPLANYSRELVLPVK